MSEVFEQKQMKTFLIFAFLIFTVDFFLAPLIVKAIETNALIPIKADGLLNKLFFYLISVIHFYSYSNYLKDFHSSNLNA